MYWSGLISDLHLFSLGAPAVHLVTVGWKMSTSDLESWILQNLPYSYSSSLFYYSFQKSILRLLLVSARFSHTSDIWTFPFCVWALKVPVNLCPVLNPKQLVSSMEESRDVQRFMCTTTLKQQCDWTGLKGSHVSIFTATFRFKSH